MSGYSQAGVALAFVLIAVYLARVRGRAQLEDAAGLLLGAAGVATGVKLAVICTTASSLGPFGAEDRLYILLGGVALEWVSGKTIWRALRGSPPPAPARG